MTKSCTESVYQVNNSQNKMLVNQFETNSTMKTNLYPMVLYTHIYITRAGLGMRLHMLTDTQD